MKEVKITDTMLKEYKDGELVHYIATQLRDINNVTLGDQNDFNFGVVMVEIERLSDLISAVDKRMNKISKDPNIML